jgi:hypothetical protein
LWAHEAARDPDNSLDFGRRTTYCGVPIPA